MDVDLIHIRCSHARIRDDLAKHRYRWLELMAERPCLSLAIYEPNQYLVCIAQHHVATLGTGGKLLQWKYVESDYCMRLYASFREGAFQYLVTDPVRGGPVTDELALDDPDAEDCDSGDLLPPGREERVRDLSYHMLRALHDLHSAGFAHLNLQWGCVWLDRNNHAMLGGFENLTPIERAEEAILGHPLYRPPEALRSGTCTFTSSNLTKIDMWALGICVIEALIGEWVGSRAYQSRGSMVAPGLLLRDIQEHLPGLRARLVARGVSHKAADFVEAMLRMEPEQRPAACDAINHPWMISLLEPKSLQDGYCNLPLEDELPEMMPPIDTSYLSSDKGPKGYGFLAAQLRGVGYQLESVHHRSQHGTWVLLAHSTFDSRQVAIKRKISKRSGRGERMHWPTLCHQNILDVLDAFAIGGHLFFVTKWMARGDLQSILDKKQVEMTEEYMRGITVNILQAFVYLHERGMAHLNFSFQHVLLDADGRVRLGGFDRLRSIRGQGPLQFGYLPLRAPECFRSGATMRANLPKLDMWSLGAAILRAMMHKSIAGHEFRSSYSYTSTAISYRRLLDNLVLLPGMLEKSKLSCELQKFLMCLLQFRPEMRPSAEDALHHAWITSMLVPEESPLFSSCDSPVKPPQSIFAASQGRGVCDMPMTTTCTEPGMKTYTPPSVKCPPASRVGACATVCPKLSAVGNFPTPKDSRTLDAGGPCFPDVGRYRRSSDRSDQSGVSGGVCAAPPQRPWVPPTRACVQPPPPCAPATGSDSDSMTSLMAEHVWNKPQSRYGGSQGSPRTPCQTQAPSPRYCKIPTPLTTPQCSPAAQCKTPGSGQTRPYNPLTGIHDPTSSDSTARGQSYRLMPHLDPGRANKP